MEQVKVKRSVSVFGEMEQDDRYLGWGYLNGRRQHLEAGFSTRLADAAVLKATADWSDDELFEWVNSRPGRWFADEVFGGEAFDVALERAKRFGLLNRIIVDEA